ncbi:MAG: hypothetical protein A2521_17220 [Deltaproteobacteria bacterium RIFOXYD12_FULL_57_12]|nr:MAG: hypothetical protein A2521_17220 [Deltaproteobacteria bacterium RIFOXYD12_FULL_57_12]
MNKKKPVRERYTGEIDYLYDALFPETNIEVTKIDNFYDELFPESSASSAVGWVPATLEFVDGNRQKVAGVRLFQPAADYFTLRSEVGAEEKPLPLIRLCCLRMAAMPDDFPDVEPVSSQIEVIETVDGRSHQAYVPADQNLETGFFGCSVQEAAPDRYLFFPHCNIKLRYLRRYIGEILVEKGMIDNLIFHRALDEFQQLKKQKLGQIIAKQANILNSVVEREIQKIYRQNITRFKVGEILVATGLVSEEQVKAAMAVQEKIKKQRIGTFLIEKGMLREEDFFVALAEKFRTSLVDLRQVGISRKAFNCVPREVALELQILPLNFKNSGLVVATMDPDVPSVREVIARHAGQQNIQFVLALPAHLKAAMKKLYMQPA